MATDGPTLERQGEMRERPSVGGEPTTTAHPDTALQRTPEIRETESGNVEVRKDPDHTVKVSNPIERILDPRGASVATQPHDILAVRRSVEETDTPLE